MCLYNKITSISNKLINLKNGIKIYDGINFRYINETVEIIDKSYEDKDNPLSVMLNKSLGKYSQIKKNNIITFDLGHAYYLKDIKYICCDSYYPKKIIVSILNDEGDWKKYKNFQLKDENPLNKSLEIEEKAQFIRLSFTDCFYSYAKIKCLLFGIGDLYNE